MPSCRVDGVCESPRDDDLPAGQNKPRCTQCLQVLPPFPRRSPGMFLFPPIQPGSVPRKRGRGAGSSPERCYTPYLASMIALTSMIAYITSICQYIASMMPVYNQYDAGMVPKQYRMSRSHIFRKPLTTRLVKNAPNSP